MTKGDPLLLKNFQRREFERSKILRLFPAALLLIGRSRRCVYVLDDQIALVLMRGDHELNETKLMDASGAINVRPAQPDEIREALGASAGSLGAVGVTPASHPKIFRVIADDALQGRQT